MSKTVADLLNEASLRRKNSARWIVGCGGNETPFICQGRRLLYVWNGLSGDDCEHAYLDLGTDLVLSIEEELALGLR